jgi:hypothetical protein
MDKPNIVSFNTLLAAILFGVGGYWIVHTQNPLLVKIVVVVVAYFVALHWLYDYMPQTARFLGKFSVLLIIEIFTAIMSLGSSRRR